MSEGNCPLKRGCGWAKAGASAAPQVASLMDKAAASQWGTKARQQACARLCERLLFPAGAEVEFCGRVEILGSLPQLHLPRSNAVPKDGLMSRLLLQKDVGSRDKVMRTAEPAAAGAASWNNTVTPAILVKLLVSFECRAQWLWLGTGQWEKSRFSVRFHPVLAPVPPPLSKTAACCLK